MKMRAGTAAVLSILCVLSMLVFAEATGGFLAWFLLYFLVLLAVYEWLTWLMTLRHIQVARTLSTTRLSAGQTLNIEIHIRRKGFWPMFWLRIQEDLPKRWRFQVDGLEPTVMPLWRRSYGYQYQIQQVPRGVYALGDTHLESGDLLGIVKLRKTCLKHDVVIVYPQVVPVRGWGGSQPEEYGQRQPTRRRAEDTSNVLGVRRYVPGDRLSRIHWPASARSGVLQAKEFELHVTSEFMFIPDVSRTSYQANQQDTFDLAMTITASLMKYAYDLHRLFGAKIHADRLIAFAPGCDEALFMKCMETLAEVEATGNVQFPQSLTRIAQENAGGQTFVIISPRLTQASAIAAAIARRRGGVEWFVPVPGQSLTPDEMRILHLLQAERIHVHLIATPEQLSTLTRGGVARAKIQ